MSNVTSAILPNLKVRYPKFLKKFILSVTVVLFMFLLYLSVVLELVLGFETKFKIWFQW